MSDSSLRVSYGQAYLAQDRQSARSAMTVCDPEDPRLAIKGMAAVVADSIWRNSLAKQAGETCVRGFIADYFATPDQWDVKYSANRVLCALNTWLYSQSRTLVKGSYISSMSALILQGRQGHLFHMGDTLVYRLRAGDTELLNREHTTFLGGYRYPSRALGMDPSLDIDYLNLSLRVGDLFLLTTQASKGTLMPSELMQVIHQHQGDLNASCDALLQLAREKASRRGYSNANFCFQLVRIEHLPPVEAPSVPVESAHTVVAEPEQEKPVLVSVRHLWLWRSITLLLLILLVVSWFAGR